jgi:hypothetical protein
VPARREARLLPVAKSCTPAKEIKMPNAYDNHATGPASVARRRYLVTPNDDVELKPTAKALCIDNKGATAAVVRIWDGADAVSSIDVPAYSKWTEPCIVTRVLATGTTASADLIIHAYAD